MYNERKNKKCFSLIAISLEFLFYCAVLPSFCVSYAFEFNKYEISVMLDTTSTIEIALSRWPAQK